MRKAILMVLLVVSGNAMAEWVMVSHNKFAIGYADPATIVMDGNHAKMWTLVDCMVMSNFIGGSPFMSIKSREEFDCKENRLRTLVYSLHSGNMGEGDEVFVDSNPSKWSPAPFDRGMNNFFRIACGSR
jgi:hypothetical protein